MGVHDVYGIGDDDTYDQQVSVSPPVIRCPFIIRFVKPWIVWLGARVIIAQRYEAVSVLNIQPVVVIEKVSEYHATAV